MSRRWPVAIAAAAVAITLGVLIGLVLGVGRQVRTGQPRSATPNPGSSSSTGSPSSPGSSSAGPSSSAQLVWVAPASNMPAPSTPVSSTPVSSTPVSSTPAVSTSGSSIPAVSTPASSTPAPPTPAPSTLVTIPTTSRTSSLRTSVRRTRSSAVPPPVDGPAGRCPVLGARISFGPTTAYCQHDQHDGMLRWREVRADGGCLNRTMTGTGVDGLTYRCVRTAGQLNHWQRG